MAVVRPRPHTRFMQNSYPSSTAGSRDAGHRKGGVRHGWIVGVCVVAVVVIALSTVSAFGTSDANSVGRVPSASPRIDFNSEVTLARWLEITGAPEVIRAVTCTRRGGHVHEFNCRGLAANGHTIVAKVHVSDDGHFFSSR